MEQSSTGQVDKGDMLIEGSSCSIEARQPGYYLSASEQAKDRKRSSFNTDTNFRSHRFHARVLEHFRGHSRGLVCIPDIGIGLSAISWIKRETEKLS